MTNSIVRIIAAGFLAGLALFMLPIFLIKIAVFFMLIGAVRRLLGFRRHGMHPAFAHKWRNLSEDERAEYMQRFGRRCHRFEEKFEEKENIMDTKSMI